jgi:hypothetical protein
MVNCVWYRGSWAKALNGDQPAYRCYALVIAVTSLPAATATVTELLVVWMLYFTSIWSEETGGQEITKDSEGAILEAFQVARLIHDHVAAIFEFLIPCLWRTDTRRAVIASLLTLCITLEILKRCGTG